MTKDKALYKWFSDFGMTVYTSTSVPDDIVFPYMTYEYNAGSFATGEVNCVVRIWYKTTSEALPNEVAERFRQYIEEHPNIRCDDGLIWVKQGIPWCQSIIDGGDNTVKGRYINIGIEYHLK